MELQVLPSPARIALDLFRLDGGPQSALVALDAEGRWCFAGFPGDGEWETPAAAEALVRAYWPDASLCWRDRAPAKVASLFRRAMAGERVEWTVAVTGTALQIDVWRALGDIPRGESISYSELAVRVKRPRAVRAVASAVGANPVSGLIPCHRVRRRDGSPGGYRWGLVVKAALLASETR